jgi:hypothetical protein
MNVWMKSLLALLGALVSGATATVAVGGYSWNRQTEQMLERLRQTAHDPEPAAFASDELRGLPAPVVRYFEFALTPGQPMVRSARIEHQGEFRGGLEQKWSPFHSVQHFTVAQPGFVWDARIRMVPLLGVRVRDSYIAGEAGMLGKLGGTIAVIDQAGTPSLNSGALHRYFMERAWLPTALLPSQGVRWEPIDDTSARAFFSDHELTLSMDVFFGPQGEISRVEAMRMRDVDGVGVLTPFVGEFRDYQRIDGMMVPMAGEVEWVLPEGRLNFWRGRITAAQYEFAAAQASSR